MENLKTNTQSGKVNDDEVLRISIVETDEHIPGDVMKVMMN